jgi:hypothetical protein
VFPFVCLLLWLLVLRKLARTTDLVVLTDLQTALQFVKSLTLTHRVGPMEATHPTHHAVHVVPDVVDMVLPDHMVSLTRPVEQPLKCHTLPWVQQDRLVTHWHPAALTVDVRPAQLDELRHMVLTAPMVLSVVTFPTPPPDLLVTDDSMAAHHSG